MNTAGVILDFYDDVAGSLVKQANASLGSPGELAATLQDFHFLTPEEHEVLRDEAYALVMQDEGKVFRKFACVDEGNTVLSVLYFMENWDKLPTEAVKVAAANLEEWCGEYQIPVPHFLKLAKVSGMSRTRDSTRQPIVGEEADWAQRTNLTSIQGGADSGRVIPTASQMKTAGVPRALRSIAEDVYDYNVPARSLTKAQQYATARVAANNKGRGLGRAARDGSVMSRASSRQMGTCFSTSRTILKSLRRSRRGMRPRRRSLE